MGLERVPITHYGWTALAEALETTVANAEGRAFELHDGEGHTPLRWRMLVAAREEEGLTFKEIGDLFGMSMQAAAKRYEFWKDKLCCRADVAE